MIKLPWAQGKLTLNIKVQLDNWPGDTKLDVAKIDTSGILLLFGMPGTIVVKLRLMKKYAKFA